MKVCKSISTIRFRALHLPALLFAALVWCVCASGCISDSFDTSPNVRLVFSGDTVSFDTVFTGEGTPTARLLVYNRAKKSVKISSIRFRSPQTCFQLNVDGVSGRDFSDVEIRGRDSIYVFIECLLPETSGSRPYLVEDQLDFVTNGNQQSVQVEAYGQNVYRLKGKTLTEDTRFTADRPVVVYDSLVVAPGVELTLDPGVKLLFHDKARMTVRGTLTALGAPGHFIDMRGDRLDNVLPEIGYDILAGQWEGLRFAAESFGNRMECVDLRSTVSGVRVDSCGNMDRSKLVMVNSWLHNSQGAAFSSAYARVDAYGCVFSEAADAVVSLRGGEHEFVQCTLANNYLFAAIREPLLTLESIKEDEEGAILPPMKASFRNSIIYGLAKSMNVGDLNDTEVWFDNVLFKSEGNDDEHFRSCLWDTDPDFYTDRPKYYFNYRVRPDSPAFGAGDPAFVTPVCLYDMDGFDRLAEGAPTLGAYCSYRAEDEGELP